MARIDRKSSIENEPRTLNIYQMHFAREAAVYVVNTSSSEGALRIFTEGLEPVISSISGEQNRRTRRVMMENDEDEFHIINDSSHPRDIASAPF